MKYLPVLFCGIAVLVSFNASALAEPVDVWIGTTTPKNGLSKGIYHLTFDTDKGKLSKSTLAAEIGSPGFLAVDLSAKRLYATGSVNGQASVAAYEINGDRLKFLNSQPIGDGGAAHVSVNTEDRFLLTAQYGGGSVAVFPLRDDGSIGARSQLIDHAGGSKVVPGRQDSSHAHWTGFDNNNKFAFVPDLGLDAVVIYKIDSQDRKITPHGRGVVPPGGGPRHMKFHPNGKYAYVLNELALSITVFAYASNTGTMVPIETVQTLTDAQKSKEAFNSASEIRIHDSGRFVYSANRGHDSISVFRVDSSTGRLTRVEVEPIRGGWPRNFNIDPSGKWLLAAGRDSNTLTVFSINQDSGELTYSREVAFVPTPICVEFGE
jgi:6-phosphogluconolactonase